MLATGMDFMLWQQQLNTEALFPRQDVNNDNAVTVADLAVISNEFGVLPDADEYVRPITDPVVDPPERTFTGLVSRPDLIWDMLNDDNVTAAAVEYGRSDQLHVRIPQEHAFRINVLGDWIDVKGEIRVSPQDGYSTVKVALTEWNQPDNAPVHLNRYWRMFRVPAEGAATHLDGTVAFERSIDGEKDIYTGKNTSDGWRLATHKHTDPDADWKDEYRLGWKITRNGWEETHVDTTALTSTTKMIWSGPIDPTKVEVDSTEQLVQGQIVIDQDTETTYDEEVFDGLLLVIPHDETIVTQTDRTEPGYTLDSTVTETREYNHRIDLESKALSIYTGEEGDTRFFEYEHGDNVFDSTLVNGDTESLYVIYNDQRLGFFLAGPSQGYAVHTDTFGIEDAVQLNSVVRYLEGIETMLGGSPVSYMSINASLPINGG